MAPPIPSELNCVGPNHLRAKERASSTVHILQRFVLTLQMPSPPPPNTMYLPLAHSCRLSQRHVSYREN